MQGVQDSFFCCRQRLFAVMVFMAAAAVLIVMVLVATAAFLFMVVLMAAAAFLFMVMMMVMTAAIVIVHGALLHSVDVWTAYRIFSMPIFCTRRPIRS